MAHNVITYLHVKYKGEFYVYSFVQCVTALFVQIFTSVND